MQEPDLQRHDPLRPQVDPLLQRALLPVEHVEVGAVPAARHVLQVEVFHEELGGAVLGADHDVEVGLVPKVVAKVRLPGPLLDVGPLDKGMDKSRVTFVS